MKNSLILYLIAWGKKQSFQPNFLSFIINPFFFIRLRLFQKIRKLAPKLEGKLLDFGCGRKPYKNLFVNVKEYIGLDMQQTGHDHSLSEIDVFYDGKKIPFENETFDAIFSAEVFEHIFNLDEILDELYRVLKKDGKMLITIPFMWGEHEQPYDYARYTSFAIRHILEQKGFRIITSEKTGKASETILQLYTSYLYSFFPKNKILSVILNVIFIFPLHLLGGIFTLILPNNRDIYFNNVVLVQK